MPVDPVVLSSFFQDTVTKAKLRDKNVTGHNTELRLRNGLNFLCAHLGFNFQLEHKELTHTAEGAKQCSAKVHAALPRDLLAVESHFGSANKLISFFAMGVRLLLAAGIRFRHAQRSTPTIRSSDGVIEFLCAEGKSREGGAPAPPF